MSASYAHLAPAWQHPGDAPALRLIYADNRLRAARAGVDGMVDAIRETPAGDDRRRLLDLLIEQGVELRLAVLAERELASS